MTPEEIKAGRERLAKFMGWTVVYFTDELGEWEDMPSHYIDNEKNVKCEYNTWHPDQDHNQCHEIEKNLTDDEWKKYVKILWNESFDKFSASKDALFLMVKETMSATAIQRFEALINTIGEQK